MTRAGLVEPDRSNRFCPIHKDQKVTRTKITDGDGNIRYTIRCPICGLTDKT